MMLCSEMTSAEKDSSQAFELKGAASTGEYLL